VAFFLVVLDALVVVTALPSIHRSLGGSLGTLQWTVNAYSMTFRGHHHRRGARRPARPQARLHRGTGAVHRGVGGLRAGAGHRPADHGPGGAGAGCGGHHPAAVTSGYRPALAAAAGFSFIGAMAALAVRRAPMSYPVPTVTANGTSSMPGRNSMPGEQPRRRR
jgi:hypothetical protein